MLFGDFNKKHVSIQHLNHPNYYNESYSKKFQNYR